MMNRRRAVVPLIAAALTGLGVAGVLHIVIAWRTVQWAREVATPEDADRIAGSGSYAATAILGGSLLITVLYGLIRCGQAGLERPETEDRA